ncbi:MAG: hypothetical protein H7834_00165 [Magnetococcus sp. YQC-9]
MKKNFFVSPRIKSMLLAVMFGAATLPGCTVHTYPPQDSRQQTHQTPTPTPAPAPAPAPTPAPSRPAPSTPSPSSSQNEACELSYKIYKRCYDGGINNTPEFCASLTKKIYQEVNVNDRDFEAALGLFCGLACTEATSRNPIKPYSSFNRDFCKK